MEQNRGEYWSYQAYDGSVTIHGLSAGRDMTGKIWKEYPVLDTVVRRNRKVASTRAFAHVLDWSLSHAPKEMVRRIAYIGLSPLEALNFFLNEHITLDHLRAAEEQPDGKILVRAVVLGKQFFTVCIFPDTLFIDGTYDAHDELVAIV